MRADGRFGDVLARAAEYRVQVLVTPIPAEPTTGPLVTHGWRVDAEYTFAASAIKTFASVAALRKLRRLAVDVDLDTPLAWCRGEPPRCVIDGDPSNLEGGTITLGHEIRKMHLVSSNPAFNRLYDFVGHDEINEDAWALGFASLRFRHRMGQDWSLGRTAPAIQARTADGPLPLVPARTSALELEPTRLPGVEVGIAHVDHRGERHEGPRDFSRKNYVSTTDLHRLMLALMLPGRADLPDLRLAPDDRRFLLDAMTRDPLDSTNPHYPAERFPRGRYKLAQAGLERVLPAAELRYVNKPGRAYGFHVENAWIEHVPTGRAFVVTAVVYADGDGVVNDDRYRYDELSRPFFRDLGELLARELLVAPREAGSTATLSP